MGGEGAGRLPFCLTLCTPYIYSFSGCQTYFSPILSIFNTYSIKYQSGVLITLARCQIPGLKYTAFYSLL